MAQTINVNTTPGQFMPTLYYSQGDIGREFEIVLASSDGWSIPAGATVEMVATKPSGFGFSVAGTLTDNVASFTTTETMTNEHGRYPAEIRITSGTDVIGTANFYLSGERDPHPAETIDGDASEIIPELTLLVERVEAAASSVLDMTVNASTLSAGSQATYSYDEETNTATFGIPQGEAGAGAAGVTASAYSSSRTYAVGDYVIHNSNLYRCTTAITTAESFTAGHWTQVVLADDVTDVKSDLNYLFDGQKEITISDLVQGTYNSAGAVVSNANRIRTKGFIDVRKGESITFSPSTNVYGILIGYFSSSGSFIRDGQWNNELSETFDSDYKLILVFRRENTSQSITPAEYDGSTVLSTKQYNKNSEIIHDINTVSKQAYIVHKDIILTQGYYINSSNGYKQANAEHWISDFIPVEEGMMFDYRLSASSASLVIAAYSDLYPHLVSGGSVVAQGYANAVTGTYTVPAGVKYIRVCSLKWDANTSTESNKVLGCFFRYSESKEEQPEISSIDDLPFVSGRYIDANNRYVSSSDANYKATGEFIKVNKGTIIKYALTSSANCPLISFYDKYKVLVSTPVVGSGATKTKILAGYNAVPDGVEYVRFSYYDLGNSQLDIKFITSGIDLYSDKAEMIRNARRYDFILESQSSLVKPLSLLHFTDIHGTEDALKRIVEFKNTYSDIVDDAICTGDMVTASINYHGMAFWDNVDGSDDILLTIGNHDLSDGSSAISIKDQYDLYIKPYMDNWNAQTVENKTWWYKDYVNNKVRLIGLGSSYLMPTEAYTEQLTWFAGVLASALENNYSVIVAQHYLPQDGIAIESNFTQVYGRGDGDLFVFDALLSEIDSFIANGGDFICHICGHTHQDQIVYSESHPRQLFVCATTSSSDFLQQQFGDQDRAFFGNALDAFNVVTLDINKKLLKVIRVGADQDMLLRSRKAIVIKYDTKAIISEQ